jgi:hypothetical protein
MNDPKRWLEADAPAHVRDLLRAGRPTSSIDQELRGRLGQYVAKAPSHAGWLTWPKMIAAVGIVSAAGLGATKLVMRRPAPVESAPVEVAPSPIAATPEAPAQVLEEPPAAPPPAATSEPKAPRRVAPRETAIPASELEYVEHARSLLARDAAEALRLANQRAEKFPLGRLGPEAEMVAVQALERLGQNDAARARAERALARYPGSIYADGWRRRAESR